MLGPRRDLLDFQFQGRRLRAVNGGGSQKYGYPKMCAHQGSSCRWRRTSIRGIAAFYADRRAFCNSRRRLNSRPYLAGWGLLLGAVYFVAQRYPRGAVVLGLCVVSHWFLDLVVHRPDLPLFPGDSPLLGFGLWDSLVGTVLVEGLLFSAGIALYLRVTESKDRTGNWAFWCLVGFRVIVYTGNLFGPVPPNV